MHDSVAAAARLRAARAAQIPVPGLLAARQWGGDYAPGHNLILGFTLAFPLWNQGREAVAEAKGFAAQRAAEANDARLTHLSAVEAARVRTAERAQRARTARDSLLPNAQRIRTGAVRLYDAGRTSVLSVFEAMRAERTIARMTIDELLAFQQARADHLALLGRSQ